MQVGVAELRVRISFRPRGLAKGISTILPPMFLEQHPNVAGCPAPLTWVYSLCYQ